ncbi:MAG TPA: DUF362 domain-containing protein [Syntrophorhabdus sp.]|nr:DUF362 domain-containing protein [Pseudomonadota bacterium]HQM26113.1 DUF362 domain-containing protein [Syntrophorhabdus sp.]
MKKVISRMFGDYRVTDMKEFLEASLKSIGLTHQLHHKKILLKPNLVMGKAPHRAVNTHPEVVRAVAELLLDNQCSVSIGDSPGYESTERALKASGIMQVAEDLGLTIVPFNKPVKKRLADNISPYQFFTLGEDPALYGAVVNLPKLKTHGMMGLTLGVKNTFGFIHSLEKARWHLKAGQDRALFASILIDICRLVNPTVTILDGVLAMDRDGPSSGRARRVGVISISTDAFMLDHYIESILGLTSPLPVTRKALEHNLVEEYEVQADAIPEIEDFEMPGLTDTDWTMPAFVKRILKKIFVKKPRLRKKLCKSCSVCCKVCPAEAIELVEKYPVFHYDRCIRCYCCQEMCPEGAIFL